MLLVVNTLVYIFVSLTLISIVAIFGHEWCDIEPSVLHLMIYKNNIGLTIICPICHPNGAATNGQFNYPASGPPVQPTYPQFSALSFPKC